MAIFHCIAACVTRTTSRTTTTFNRSFCVLVVLTLLGFLSNFKGIVVALNGEGYCSYAQSDNVSYRATVSHSERTTKDCGLFGWSRCTAYKVAYSMAVKYRTRYTTTMRCCPGWISDSTVGKCVEPTTQQPTDAPVISYTDALPTMPTPDPPILNYSRLSTTTTQPAINTPLVGGATSPGTLPGHPVSDAGNGALFKGKKGRWYLIALIGILSVFVIIVAVVITVCYRRKRKRHRKPSDPTTVLELLNRDVPSSNGRMGESAYAEIPDGQNGASQPNPSTSTCSTNITDINKTSGVRGANQYQEIADVLQEGEIDLPTPLPREANTPDESGSSYAYAYVDSTTSGAAVHESADNIELKANSPTAEYAEVHKNNPCHPKPPGSRDNQDDNDIATPVCDEIPTTIQSYTTHIPMNETPQPNINSEQSKETVVKDDPEPYDEVEIGSGHLQNREYDNFQRAASIKPENTGTDGLPKPYGELGLRSPDPENKDEYDKIQRSISRQDNINACDKQLPSGYGVVLNEAKDMKKAPAVNSYATIDNRETVSETSGKGPSINTNYDRLDRQISTTSMQHSSSTKTSPEKNEKDSTAYSKLNRSTLRNDTSTMPSAMGYGVLGNEPQVYDRLGTGNLLDDQVPVQYFNDYDHMGISSGEEVPVNEYNTLNNAGNAPEGSYATIPNNMESKLSCETYDKLGDKLPRGHNDVIAKNDAYDSNIIQYDSVGRGNNDSLSLYDTPSKQSDPDARPHLTRQDTLYENTPKGKQKSTTNSKPTYDTPSTRNSSRQDSVNDNADGRIDVTGHPVKYEEMDKTGARFSDISMGSSYEDMDKGNRSSRMSIDVPIPSPFGPALTRKNTLYENTAREANL